MTNKNRLMGMIVSKGYSQRTLAPIVGMSKNALNLKINNKRSFKVDEIDRICRVLKITDPAEKANIFLYSQSQK